MLPLTIISFTVCAFFFTIFTHELSHAVFVKICGGDVTGFKPYPHIENGKFYFGKVNFNFYEGLNIAPVFFSPVISDVFFIVFFFVITISVNEMFFTFVVLHAIDLSAWWTDYKNFNGKDSDGYKYRYFTERLRDAKLGKENRESQSANTRRNRRNSKRSAELLQG